MLRRRPILASMSVPVVRGWTRTRARGVVRLLCLLLATALLVPPLLVRAETAPRPRVAIVFEHAGPSLTDLTPIYAMHQPFGLGIFPHMRYSAEIAR